MKSTVLKPLAFLAFSSFTLFSCASSNTTAMEDMSRTETSAMAGMAMDEDDNQLNVLVVEEQVMVPIATLAPTALLMENPEDINDMFDAIDDTENYTVLELARKSPNLTTFVQLIERANLTDDLERVEKATLFAPTNEAFAKLPKEKLEMLLRSDNTALLSRILQAHILASEVSTARFNNSTRISMGEDQYIPISTNNPGNTIFVGSAQIVRNDVEASNGRIHVIDSVILPDQDVREGNDIR